MLFPGEVAAVDDEAADRGAVAAEIFGRRINDDGRAVIERLGQDRRGGIVHDQRNPERAPDRRDLRDREGDQLRVGQSLGVIGAGARVGGFAEVLRIDRIDEAHLDPLVLHRVGEQVPGAPIEVGRGDHVVAHPREVLDRKSRSRLAARERQPRDAPFERGDALLEHVGGRIHDPGIDVAELLEREQVGGVLGALELIGGGLVDRHRDGAGGRIGAPTGVKREGFRLLGHRFILHVLARVAGARRPRLRRTSALVYNTQISSRSYCIMERFGTMSRP